jgi:hypothetical protein
LLPIIAYGAERRIAAAKPDYWDYGTLLEAAMLDRHEADAMNALANAMANIREVWEPETTARNPHLIREARQRRGQEMRWEKQIEEELMRRCDS